MGIEKYTPEQLADRWMAQREVQNLMGRYVYDRMIRRERSLYDSYWCRAAASPTLGLNGGYYCGEESIRGYYDAVHGQARVKSELMQKLYPGFLGEVSPQELHGVGTLLIDALTTAVVEVAGDGQTAKGVWYVMGVENDFHPNGPYTMLAYGYYAADFVLEDGEWRIWHLQRVNDIYAPAGKEWSKPWAMPEVKPEFSQLAALALPEPDVKTPIRETYRANRRTTPLVRVPEAYGTFAGTFSYGI